MGTDTMESHGDHALRDMGYPCPCCGYLVFEREPGGHEVCPICGWEDELAALRFPLMPSSPNGVSLVEAQMNFRAFGVVSRSKQKPTRAPLPSEPVDADWRPLDPERDNPEQPVGGRSYGDTYPWRDLTVLYYWRSSYWRRIVA